MDSEKVDTGIRENGFFYTGVRASEEQEQDMLAARSHPMIVIGGSVLESFPEAMHRNALSCGLPEIRGYYGYDFGAHQFIRLPDADQGETDRWPSRRLDDILRRHV